MIWLLPHPLPPNPVCKLDRRQTGRPRRKRDNMVTGEVGGGGSVGAKLYNGEQAWSSINYTILSVQNIF
jgi:hypothetical protein